MHSVEVWAWGKKIGLVVQEGNQITFELSDEKYRIISPLLFENSNVAKAHVKDIHEIGPISDALPGGYGMDYLGKYFTDEYGRKPSIIDLLTFVGKHALGALEFKPQSSAAKIDEELYATLQELKTRSRNVYEGEHDLDIDKLIAISNSAAGGAKTKAVVGFNSEENKIHIAQKHDSEPECYEKCIIKYSPGFLDNKEADNNEIRAEYLFSKIAKLCGINMSETWLVEDKNTCYFVTKRFDININKERLHMHSFAGLIGSDAASFTTSYDALFRVGLMLGVSQKDKEQMFKLMVFNLVFSNKDDHARNFSFLMDKDGNWKFAPAYDLTFSVHNYGASHHQLKIDKKFASHARAISIKKVAKICGIKEPMKIIEQMIEVKYKYLFSMANELTVSTKFIEDIFLETEGFDKLFRKEELQND